MTLYQRFLKLDLDTSSLGLNRSEANQSYFCTPKGANILGWAAADGIHYCFVRGFGETVFAVSPANLPGDYVHPIAGSFVDLLRLLLACGTMDALEQIHGWSEAQFADYIKESRPSDEQRAVLETLRDRLSLTPMEQPYAYVKALQAAFDYDRIPYSADYYDLDLNPAAPEIQPWKVTYDGGFWNQTGRAGTEIPIGKTFQWGDETWYLPAVYTCGKGLVADLCMEAAPEDVTAYLEKWNLRREGEQDFTEEEQERMEQCNPLNAGVCLQAELNGKPLRNEHGCGVIWLPMSCRSEGAQPQPEEKRFLEHYGLDPDRAWAIHRFSLAWATQRKPELRKLRLHLEREPVSIPGIHFLSPRPGDRIAFRHPLTGAAHTLTVQEYEAQTLGEANFPDDGMEHPTHFTAMTYTLSPDLPGRELSIRDCAEGDRPRRKETSRGGFSPAVSIGIIGGADGPTMVLVSEQPAAKLHAACSSLHFAPVDQVEWRMVFRVKRMNGCTVDVI